MAEQTTGVPERLDPGFQCLVDEIAAAHAAGAPRWHEYTPEALRAATRDLRKGAPAVPGIERRDLEVAGGAGTIPARLYVPEAAPTCGPGLVYFHGGGFTIGSVDTHDSIVAQLAAASEIKILSVDYRLAPEHPFPAAHDDALASSRWAFDHADQLGFAPDQIAIGGDSAGANLAASTCLDMREDADRRVRFQLLLYPNTTIEGEGGSRAVYADGHYLTLPTAQHFFRQYVDAATARHPRIDLLGREDLARLPPAFLSVGRCDILFDECVAYAAKLEAAGVQVTLRTYPGFIHGFYGFADRVPAVTQAFRDAGDALRLGLPELKSPM